MRVFAVWCCLFFLNPLFSQSFPSINISTAQGLPSTVYKVIQDSKGYIWFATNNGVYRFNGFKFDIYSRNEGLKSNVFDFYEDTKGRIWFLSLEPKLFYFYNDSIIEYKYNRALQKIGQFTAFIAIPFVEIDNNDNLLYSDRIADAYKISAIGKVEKIPFNGLINLDYKRPFIMIRRNCPTDSVWVKEKKKKYYMGLGLSGADFIRNRCEMCKVGNVIFFSILKKVYRLQNFICNQVKEFPSFVLWLSADRDSNIWVSTNTGAYGFKGFDLSQQPAYHILKEKKVSSVLQDKEGAYWFTTIKSGVFYYPSLCFSNVTKKDGLPSNFVGDLFLTKFGLWMGNDDGQIIHYKNNKINYKTIPGVSLTGEKNNVCEVIESVRGSTYFICSNSICKYDANELLKLAHDIKTNDSLVILSAAEGPDSSMWFGSYGWLRRLNKGESSMFAEYKDIGSIYKIIAWSNQELLLNSKTELLLYNIQSKKISRIGKKYPLLSCRATSVIKIDSVNVACIGTKYNGVVFYTKDSVWQITTKEGLTSNFITTLFYKNNSLWVGTKTGGVNKIVFRNNTFHLSSIEYLDVRHGLNSNEINSICVTDTEAYISTPEGLNIFDYKRYKFNAISPDVTIEKVKVLNGDTTIKGYYELPYNKNSVEVTVTGFCYRLMWSGKFLYRVIKDNNISDWKLTDNPKIILTYLEPGMYTLEIKAQNEDNITSKKPAVIKFKINPPFYKTLFFKFLILIIVIGVILVVYRMRINEINKRNQLEKEFIENNNKLLREIEQTKQKSLAQQMNPHFIFNSLNSIQYFILSNNPSASNKYLAKFSKLMRMILENSQENLIPMSRELEAISLYVELECMRMNNKFTYQINIDENIDTEFYKIHSLIIQPFVENAILHGILPCDHIGHINIELKEEPDYLVCLIEDNGIGRDKSDELKRNKQLTHKSYGTKLTQKRLELIGKYIGSSLNISYVDLTNSDGSVAGTRVEIQLPKILN